MPSDVLRLGVADVGKARIGGAPALIRKRVVPRLAMPNEIELCHGSGSDSDNDPLIVPQDEHLAHRTPDHFANGNQPNTKLDTSSTASTPLTNCQKRAGFFSNSGADSMRRTSSGFGWAMSVTSSDSAS